MFENDRVRVLEYRDVPGDRTTSHSHPDSVMVTLSDFDRKLVMGDQEREVSLTSGEARWLPAQTHPGENIGSTPTHSIFVELKEPGTSTPRASRRSVRSSSSGVVRRGPRRRFAGVARRRSPR